MWHASCAGKFDCDWLKRFATTALAGVGDESKQWEEWTGRAFHIRRRLTAAEQAEVGDAVDCRGTKEGQQRFEAVRRDLPPLAIRLAMEELR